VRNLAILLLMIFSDILFARDTAPEYYKDIWPVIESKCLTCHSENGVAFSLSDPKLAFGFRAAIVSAVKGGRMPPWMAEAGHQKYSDDYSLTMSDIAMLTRWSDEGFTRGKAVESAVAPRGSKRFKADFELDAIGVVPYTPVKSRVDDYRCFVLQWPRDEDGYVTGVDTHAGNPKISHHAIIYYANQDHAARYREFDEAESGAGYECFGGPLPDRLVSGAGRVEFDKANPDVLRKMQEETFWLAHWAPGMEGYYFPANTGIRIRPKSVIIVQMHYYSGFSAGESDNATRVGFRVTNTVAKPAINWPLSRSEWLQARDNRTLVVPANGKSSVSTEASFDGMDLYIAALSDLPVTDFAGVELHSANIHMHLIGASGEVIFTPDIGPSEILLKVPRFMFGWQRNFFLMSPKFIPQEKLKNMKLRVSCTFSNSSATEVFGGYGSDEEMCYNFSYIAARPRTSTVQPKDIRKTMP